MKRFALLPVLLLATSAAAESPRIAEAQSSYENALRQWEADIVPLGLSGNGAFIGPNQKSLRNSGAGRAAVKLRNVDFRFSGEIGFFVREAAVTLEPQDRDEPADLDRVDRFVIRIHRGDILMRTKALTALFNKHILDYPEAPLNNAAITISGGKLKTDAGLTLNGLPGIVLPSNLVSCLANTT